jgi:hypothetical protein
VGAAPPAAHLAPLLARLEDVRTDADAIEALHPDELALLAEREQARSRDRRCEPQASIWTVYSTLS